MLGRDPNPVPGIGYITADRPWADSRQWFDAVGFPEIAHYSLVEDRDFKLEVLTNRQTKMRGAPLLEACIATLALPPGSLIFVDPIALFLGGDLLNYYTVAVSCMQIHRGLMDTHHTIVGICHTAKQKADTKDRYLRAQDRISGSGALLGFTATQMNLMGPDEAGNDDGTYHFFVNPHHLASFTYALTKDPHTGLFVFPDAPPVPSVGPLADLDEELQTLYASLPDPPAPISTRTLSNCSAIAMRAAPPCFATSSGWPRPGSSPMCARARG